MTAPRIVIAKWPQRVGDAIWMAAEPWSVSSLGGPVVHLTHHEWLIAAALVAAYPRRVSRSEMHEHLYGEREDGGPFDGVIDVHIYALRKRLAPTGIRVVSVYTHGWTVVLPDVAARALAA